MAEQKNYPYGSEEFFQEFARFIAEEVNNNFLKVEDIADLVKSNTKPSYTASEVGADVKINEIKSQLIDLDNQAIRPLRAILVGTSTDEDREKLQELEAEAQKLRDEFTKYV